MEKRERGPVDETGPLCNDKEEDSHIIACPSKSAAELAPLFRGLFAGLPRAYGTYNAIDQTRDDGKRTGTAVTVREPVTDALWEAHLAGKSGIGIIPVRDDSTAVFGAIDIDQYQGFDLARLADVIHKLQLPLVTCRSKSGGAHLYLFASQPVDAGAVQDRLRDMAAMLGHGGSEIFPKQRRLMAKECGGWINMPYFGLNQTTRHAVDATGRTLSAEEFLALAEASKVGPEFFGAGSAPRGPESVLPDGPPCLQHLVTLGFPEGTRNNSLLNIGIYCKHRNPDSFSGDIEAFNREHMKLSSNEVAGIIKSLTRKDYRYTCDKDPLTPHCNSTVCRTRKYGIGGGTAASLPVINGLTKYDTRPPIYWMDCDGVRIELTVEEITDYRKFKLACFERINKVLPPLSAKKWDEVLRKALEKMTIETVPEDASPDGQFWELVEAYSNGRAQAQCRDELSGNKPFTENGRTYFRLAGLLNYLDRVKFRHLNMQRVTAVLNSRGGQPGKLMVSGKQIRVWSVPAFTRASDEPWPVPGGVTDSGPF